MLEINGKTLLERAIEQALRVFGQVVFSSDSMEYIAYASDRGAIGLYRPAELATDTANKWDVFKNILHFYPGTDVLVDLDVGCPLRSDEDLRTTLDLLSAGYEVSCTAYESERNPYFNMTDKSGVILMTCPWGLVANRQDAPDVYSLSPACYAMYSRPVIQYEHWSDADLALNIIPRERAWDIDTPFDYEVAKMLLEKRENA